MRMTRTSRYRWLPVRIDDFEKWQLCLLEESAQRLGAVLNPGVHVHSYGGSGTWIPCPYCHAFIPCSPCPGHCPESRSFSPPFMVPTTGRLSA
jgi:hypothetical protein